MKKIINNKLYDTEKAECIFSYNRRFPAIFSINGYDLANWHHTDVYQTIKGAYFLLDKDTNSLEEVHEEDVKRLLKNLNPDMYMELFNETVEEA